MNEVSSKLREKIENFWYYYKYWVLIGMLVLIVAADLAADIISREVPDYTVDIVVSSTVGNELREELKRSLEGIIDDSSGDGKTVVYVNEYIYSRNEDGGISLSEQDGIHLSAELQTGEVQLIVTDNAGLFADSGLEAAGAWADFPLLMAVSESIADYSVFSSGTGNDSILR